MRPSGLKPSPRNTSLLAAELNGSTTARLPDPTGLVSAEVFDTGDEPELNRHEALAAGIRAHLVEYVPEPFAGEPEAYLPGRVQNPVPLLRDVDRLKPALAEFAEPGDRENAGLV